MIAAVATGVAALAIAALVLTRSHTIVYRALAPDCEASVEYSDETGRIQTTIRGDRELGPFEIAYGDVANLLVFAGRECRSPVRCEIIEDGVSVAVSEGQHGAMCSAATAR